MSETKTDMPIDTEAPDCWPPLAHIFGGPGRAKKGDRALCGVKLMGIDLDGAVNVKMCKRCLEIAGCES